MGNIIIIAKIGLMILVYACLIVLYTIMLLGVAFSLTTSDIVKQILVIVAIVLASVTTHFMFRKRI
jgi:hypothetical protein